MLDVVYQLAVLLHMQFWLIGIPVSPIWWDIDEAKHMTHSTHEFVKISLEVELRFAKRTRSNLASSHT